MVTEVNSKNKFSERNFKRNEMLAEYFFGLSKLIVVGVGIGALTPLFTEESIGVVNIVCIAFGCLAALAFAWFANILLKVELKKK